MKKITVTGNVGRDPESRFTSTGDSFTVFSLAGNSGTKAAPKTEWFEVSCNNKLADIVKTHVKKGTRLLIEGTPGLNVWQDKSGNPMGVIRIFATFLEFLGTKDKEDEVTEDHVEEEIDS